MQSATDEFLTLAMNVPQTQTIATPGQRDYYDFVLTEATLVYFDSQTTNAAFDSWNLRWDLTGAQGTLVSDRPFRQSDSYEGTSILLLQPGEYTLGVRGVGAQTGAYTFRLLDLTNAPTIATGAAVSGTLNPANETEAYRFAANAGDRYFFDRTANSGGDTYWRLLDPFGRTVWGPTYMPNNDVDVTTLAFDGDYTLLIEGRYHVSGTASYTFNVQPTPITERVIITGLGTVPGPDLQVENLVITPDGDALLSGGQVTIAWDVVNRGSEPANAPWLDRVLVRNTDRGEIIGNVLVEYADLGDIADDPLAPGERRSRTATLTLPAGNRGAGNLRFEVLADVSNVVTELGAGGLAELNNSASLVRDVALAPYPDLRVAGLSVTPAGGFVPGAEVTVRWNVVNAGDAAVTAGWTDQLLVRNLTNGQTVIATTVAHNPVVDGALAAGGQRAREFTLAWPAGVVGSGLFEFIVVTDSGTVILENNPADSAESNNDARLVVASAPDLVVQNLRVTSGAAESGAFVTVAWSDVNGGIAPTAAGWSDRIVVRNQTTGETLLDTALAYDPALPGNGPLAIGGVLERSHTFRLPDGLRGAGNVRITITTDQNTAGQGALPEYDAAGNAVDNNNSASIDIAAAEKLYADLVVTSFSAPLTGRGGEIALLSWLVTNQGDVATGTGFVDRVILSDDTVIGDADDVVLGSFTRTSALGVGESYTGTLSPTLPLRLDGTYFLAVRTDATVQVLEPDTRADNTTAPRAITIAAPHADLRVEIVDAPAEVRGGQAATVAWRVRNAGDAATDVVQWTDSLYLSADDILDAGDTLLAQVQRNGAVAAGGNYTLSASVFPPNGLTGSYRFLVQADATGVVYEAGLDGNNTGASLVAQLRPAPIADLVVTNVVRPDGGVPTETRTVTWTVDNIGDAAAAGTWVDRIYLTANGTLADAVLVASVTQNRNLAAGTGYTDATRSWCPISPTAATASSSSPTRATRSTRTRTRTTTRSRAPTAWRSCIPTSPPMRCGSAPTPCRVRRSPSRGTSATRVRACSSAPGPIASISRATPPSASGDLLVLSRTVTRALAAGEGYTEDGSFVLPIEATGDYFVIVVTDAAGQVRELNAEANNVASAPLTVALAPYAQLAVSDVSAPAISIGDPVAVTIGWTVTNVGNGAGQTARWTDTVVASTDAIAGNGDDIVLGRFVHDGALDVGEHYDRDETFLLAPRFQGRYTLFVRTDADGEVFENGFEADNAASSAMPFDVMTIPYADLVVENLVPATSGTSGRSLAIEWDVRNQGIGITNTVDWSDVVYLSASPDGSNPIALGSFSHIGFLAPDGTYHRSGVVTLPEGIAGTYYVVVQTGGPFEFVYTGNNRRVSGPIEVSLTPPPDLVVSDIVTPAVAPEGSAIDVSWTVVNQGGGEARGSWTDAVFLRKFGDTGPGTQIGTYVWEGPLQAGMSYTRREQIVLPSHTSDRYELIVRTDFANTVYEHTREDNNQSTDDTQVSVSVLPRPDLQVSWVGGPATMDAGGTGSIEFRVINQGPRATNVANWTDRVYLSLDDKVSTDDILVGSIQNGAALEPGEEYLSNTGTFQVPKRFRGTVYAIVVADQGGGVDEWPNDTNNTALLPIYVNPWPFSDLVVSEVRAPAQAFEGNEVEVRYTVTNLGSGETDRGTWTEQIWLTKDRNRPHPAQGDILLQSIVHNEGPLVRNAGYDRVVTVQLPDHVVSGTYYLTPWVDPYAQLFEDPLAINVNPDDPNEYNSSNYKARAIDVIGIPPIVLHPDLKVVSVTAEPEERAGEEFTFSWTVVNEGQGAAGTGWWEQVYVSDNAVLDAPGAKQFFLGTYDPVKSLAAGESYTNTQTVLLEPTVKGQYVHVRLVNRPYLQPEDLDQTDQIATTTTNITSAVPNLKVDLVQPEPQAFSGERTTIRYTVTNDSDDPIWRHTAYWTDKIYLSKDPTFIPDQTRVTLLAVVQQPNTGPFGPHQSYSREIDVTLPPGIEGDYYVYVFANTDPRGLPGTMPYPVEQGDGAFVPGDPYETYYSHAWEYSLDNMGRGSLPVVYREPNLQVTDLVVPDTVVAGSTIEVSFTVTNVGGRDTREDVWTDRMFLSIDPSLDANDTLLEDETDPAHPVVAEYTRRGVLKAGESYTATVKITVPFEISGGFHVLAHADARANASRYAVSNISPRLAGVQSATDRVREFRDEGDNITVAAVTVTPYVAPDLQVTALSSPLRAVRGQRFDLSYTVTNLGGATPLQQSKWEDLVYLSRDGFLDTRADRFLGSISRTSGLDAGQSYSISTSYAVPTDLATEAYYVFVVTDPNRYDARGAVYEGGNERNNDRTGAVPMVVELPPPSDLVVTDVVVPSAVISGTPIQLRWTVTNQSAEAASGTWTDSLFLSEDAIWDIGDRPIGRQSFTGSVAAGASYDLQLDTLMPAAAPGQYRVIVRTDIYNQVYEGVDDANNRTASPSTLEVTVDELVIGAPLLTTLADGQEKLYRISVPRDQTLRVTLQAGDDASANEIFLRHDAVPTSAVFDAMYEGQLSSDLTAIVPSTEPGTYYLLVRNFKADADGVPVRLLAELLPLVITGVHTDTGGDSRHVTTTITGAQFQDGAIVKLVRPGIAEYEPLAWRVVDSTTIIATFDFTDAPHGLYDVKVINPDGNSAVVPYRFLVERAIEPEVTIGVGGPRVILAGDQATYSVALQNISNLDAPYTYFEVGVPQLLQNPIVYGLPYLEFYTNVRGAPEGGADGPNADVPWVHMESIVNTIGQLATEGFIFDHAADGFGGFSFNVTTYPGLKELHDRAFEAFRSKMAAFFPDLDGMLADGEAGIGNWWEAVKAKAEEAAPGLGAAMGQIDFVEMYNENAAVPDKCVIPFIPFRFHVYAAATTMTRAEFVEFQSQRARDLRTALLDSDDAPASLVALAADEQNWVDLYLAALEDAELLRPDGETPPIRTQQHIVSLMSVIAAGLLYGPAGSEIRSDGDLVGFFEQVRTLYGHDQNRMADIEYWDYRESDCYEGEVPVPAIPLLADHDLGLSTPTHFEAFRVYVPWMGFDQRGAGLPPEFQINGPEPVGGDEFAALDFTRYLTGQTAASGRLASITGPQTYDTAGWLPVGQALPYTINFENATGSSRYVNEVRVTTQLDADLDARSFELGDIRIGDITIDVPEGRSLFQGEFDFAATRGFILRVSAGIDLYQEQPAATWLIQAIDPLTGELLQDTTRGLLKPNDAQGGGAGFVSYTVQASSEAATGSMIAASARVLFDTQAPEDTLTLEQMVDGVAPVTTLTANRIGTTDSYSVGWTSVDDIGGSGFDHLTLYVATDGGDFKVWQRDVAVADGSFVYVGEAGHTYEFLALATDVAGNHEKPQPGVNAVAEGNVNLGALPVVPETTPPNFGIAPTPTTAPSTNPLFVIAETGIPNANPLTRPSEFDQVMRPFVAQSFVTGIEQSHGDIGPMAIVETAGGDFIISGGANRGSLYRVSREGGVASQPFAVLDDPVFNLAFDSEGRLWATSGGGALLQLDADTGAVLNRFGDGVTIALAIEPDTDRIYVSTNSGVQIFDQATGTFTQYSRDRNLRVGSLAFDDEGELWAVTWPDRRQVVRFTEQKRAEMMVEFDSDIDSIAFGRQGTALEGLLFVSHNAGAVADTGLAASGSELTMVDIATLRRVAVATGGTRGDVVFGTSDGRLLVSQSHEVDVLNPVFAPSVIATYPPTGSTIPLPLPFLSVMFNQDMFAGDASLAQSVLNPANFRLVGAGTGAQVVQSVQYDAEHRTALLTFGQLLPDTYTLTIDGDVSSVFGQALAGDYSSTFTAVSDLSAYLDVQFGLTRFDRALGTVSYDVTITNTGDTDLVLPAVLTLDPRDGYAGIPSDAAGRTDDGRWMIDLSANLPANGRLAPGATTTGRTVSIATPDHRRVDFATGVSAATQLNRAPTITSTPPGGASVGQAFEFQVVATDPDGQPVVFQLFSGPDGMTIDALTGLLSWAPGTGARAQETVTLQVFDSRGASALQRFVLDVAGGNSAPEFTGLPSGVEGREGQTIEFDVVALDVDRDALTLWADNLPAGASFDAVTRRFSWIPGYAAAGTYQDIRFFVSDGVSVSTASVDLIVAEGYREPSIVKPADRTVREGDRIRFFLDAEGDESRVLEYSSSFLPWGATLHPVSGLFEWTPAFTQAGTYDVPFTVTDGQVTKTVTSRFTVTNANGAPVFDPQDGWVLYEGQPLVITAYALDPDNPQFTPLFRDANGEIFETGDRPRTVTVTANDLPAGATFDADTWDFRWTPTGAQAGEYFVTFHAVDDGDGTGTPLSADVVVPIRVLNLNRPPVVEAIANVTLTRDTVREITVRATDPEGNPLVLSVESELPGFPAPDFVTLTDHGDGTATLRLAPIVGDRGDHALRIVARDNGDGIGEPITGSYVFVVDVESDNEPPRLGYLGDVVGVVGKTMRIPVRVADLDQDPLSYELAGLPAGASIVPTAVYGFAEIVWTPTAADLGNHDATVTVRDSGNNGTGAVGESTGGFRIVVRNANSAPVLVPVGDRTVTEGAVLSFQLRALDADGDVVSFLAEDLPAGAVLDPLTGVFTWRPALNTAGTRSITFVATDGDGSSRETIDVVIANANQLPVFVPMIPQLAREGAELIFTVVAADADADPVVMAAANLPDGALFVASRGEFQWTPGFAQAGDHVVRFTAADPSGTPVHFDVTIRVANVDRPPVLDEFDHSFLIGEHRAFTVRATDPDAGADLSFSAIGLPEGATLDADTGVFSWTPGAGQSGEYVITVVAHDGHLSDRQTIVLRASLEPVPPTVLLELTPSFPAIPGQRVLVHAVADSFAAITSLRVFVAGQEVTLDADGRAYVTPTTPGKLDVRAVATDADGGVGETSAQLKTRDPADRSAPVVALDSALTRGRLRAATPLLGTVQDINLDFWKLEIAHGADGAFTLLAEGDASVDGTLATLDPATLSNGFYTLRLTARDIGGRTSTTTATFVEIDTDTKAGDYRRSDADLTVDLGGVGYTLVRQYSSLDTTPGAFGAGWSLPGRDIRFESNVAVTGREALGVYDAYAEGTRIWMTLPDGTRAAFRFAPVAETVGTVQFFRPAWIADDGGAWTLASTDVLLTKGGTKFYAAATAQPYNPMAPGFDGADFTLTGPDGTRYVLDAADGVQQIVTTTGKRLFVSDNGVTAENGATLQFLRDAGGRIERAVAPDGTTLVYQYGAAGELLAVRNLTSGAGARYAYEAGRLASVVVVGQSGFGIEYAADGSVRTLPVIADLGGSAEFTGDVPEGDLAAGATALYAFSVRASEIAATNGGQLILRVAVTGSAGLDAATPVIPGFTPLSVQRTGDRVVALYAFDREGLYQLRLSGANGSAGHYAVELSVAGDVNIDGMVDGADGVVMDAGGPSTDVDGDGDTDRNDRQVMYANFGMRMNLGPQIAATMPLVFTHEGLPIRVDLATVAADPDGDIVFYRVLSAAHGSAALSADGRAVIFTPDAGFTGAAAFEIMADDGFNASAPAQVAVTVSSAPLVSLEFRRRAYELAPGTAARVEVIGDFADQADVVLPLDYVGTRLENTSIATLTRDGVLSAAAPEGTTILLASRGALTVATSVTVGEPDVQGAIGYFHTIDAYPDAITLVPEGGNRQIVVNLADPLIFVGRATDGTRYFSSNTDVVTVTADGLIEAVGEGVAEVTVIHYDAEEVLRVRVDAPQTGPVVVAKDDGAIVRNAEGYAVAIGPGLLSGNATVAIEGVAEADLALPLPGAGAFGFVGAFDLSVDGGDLLGPVQIAVPVAASVAAPGDQIFFMRKMTLPMDAGLTREVWTVVDSGTVGADGYARTASPPYRGARRSRQLPHREDDGAQRFALHRSGDDQRDHVRLLGSHGHRRGGHRAGRCPGRHRDRRRRHGGGLRRHAGAAHAVALRPAADRDLAELPRHHAAHGRRHHDPAGRRALPAESGASLRDAGDESRGAVDHVGEPGRLGDRRGHAHDQRRPLVGSRRAVDRWQPGGRRRHRRPGRVHRRGPPDGSGLDRLDVHHGDRGRCRIDHADGAEPRAARPRADRRRAPDVCHRDHGRRHRRLGDRLDREPVRAGPEHDGLRVRGVERGRCDRRHRHRSAERRLRAGRQADRAGFGARAGHDRDARPVPRVRLDGPGHRRPRRDDAAEVRHGSDHRGHRQHRAARRRAAGRDGPRSQWPLSVRRGRRSGLRHRTPARQRRLPRSAAGRQLHGARAGGRTDFRARRDGRRQAAVRRGARDHALRRHAVVGQRRTRQGQDLGVQRRRRGSSRGGRRQCEPLAHAARRCAERGHRAVGDHGDPGSDEADVHLAPRPRRRAAHDPDHEQQSAGVRGERRHDRPEAEREAHRLHVDLQLRAALRSRHPQRGRRGGLVRSFVRVRRRLVRAAHRGLERDQHDDGTRGDPRRRVQDRDHQGPVRGIAEDHRGHDADSAVVPGGCGTQLRRHEAVRQFPRRRHDGGVRREGHDRQGTVGRGQLQAQPARRHRDGRPGRQSRARRHQPLQPLPHGPAGRVHASRGHHGFQRGPERQGGAVHRCRHARAADRDDQEHDGR